MGLRFKSLKVSHDVPAAIQRSHRHTLTTGKKNHVNQNISLTVEMEAVVQTKVKQDLNTSKTAAIQEKQTVDHKAPPQVEADKEMKKHLTKPNKGEKVLPVIITTLLLVPLVVVISIGVFVSWKKNSMYDKNHGIVCRKSKPFRPINTTNTS